MNQDAVLIVRVGDGAELMAVADGMGGHLGGETASRLALDTIRAALESGSDLEHAIHAANDAVLAEAAATPDLRGMGTTVVAVLRRGYEYQIANVGDSRAYRIDAAGITQLTEDHSFVAEAVRSGSMSADEAARSQWRNAVTRAVGTEKHVEVDCYGPFEIDVPHTLLLCTDGLYRWVDVDRMRNALDGEPGTAARILADSALAAGGDDNVTVAVMRAEPARTAADRAQPATAPGHATPARNDASRSNGPQLESFLLSHDPASRPQRVRKPSSGWTLRKTAVILGVIVLVMIYVALLQLIF